ncbi:hypothetical protein MUK42_19641 [Musa troglodytarum]|uniref:Uncharacterized protein n=1 Tax=Musa troglodytarum TaxID=320322 RepID=A0A9E7KYG6_9LILI|nr:hypothetical protein MUK42_19641 [Musa troglodytarum]
MGEGGRFLLFDLNSRVTPFPIIAFSFSLPGKYFLVEGARISVPTTLKVRGKPIKVAKTGQEEAQGRAYKRMQYNRRFVTAVVGFGKKRPRPRSRETKVFRSEELGAFDVFVLSM